MSRTRLLVAVSLLAVCGTLLLAASPTGAVTVTQRSLTPLCLDGRPIPVGQRHWDLTPQEHVLAFTMHNDPRPGIPDAAPGVAAIHFTPSVGHGYEVEVRAPAGSFSLRVWSAHDWTPVVRDRSANRIVSSDPVWTTPACGRR